jgi:Carboxypeptidase regulatory-like domain
MRSITSQLFTGLAAAALLVAVGSPAPASAGVAARPSQTNPVPGPPQWTGVVTDPDGNPVSGVRFVGSQSANVTGADGRYLTTTDGASVNFFGDFVPPLSTGLAIVYVQGTQTGLPPYTLDVVVPRAGKVAGTLVDTGGSPIVGTAVLLLAPGTSSAAAPQRTVLTGSDGAFEIGQIAPGENTVKIFLPDGTSFSRPVTVTAGQTTVLPTHLTPGTLAGQVTREGGLPLLRGVVIATRSSDGAAFPIPFGPDGNFSLELAPGAYRVEVSLIYVADDGSRQEGFLAIESVAITPGQSSAINPVVPDGGPPPPLVPEAPWPVLLPLTALLGAAAITRRRQRTA